MRLPFLPVRGCCRQCGRAVPDLDREFLCEECRVGKPFFDRAASALRFEDEARQLVLAFKFKRHLWLRNDFADFLEGCLRARFVIKEIDIVLPMPATWWHRLDRGYNQCESLARVLAKRCERPFSSRAVRRTGLPKRQGGLGEEERRENVKGTFLVPKNAHIENRTILVVDDIMTTGSTLSECARALKAAGASRVWCLTLCRSIRI